VQRLTDGSKKDEQPRVFREGPNLLIVLDETKISTEKLVERFFSFVSHDVLSFYRESLLSKLAGIEGRR
jgi:hypothetical protein